MLSQLKKKCNNFFNKIYARKLNLTLRNLVHNNTAEKTLYYFCIPLHSNLGDQAQMLCWLRLFAEWYPDYSVIPVACESLSDDILREIRKRVKKTDKLFIHSGYLIFDPHPHLPYICKIIDLFHDCAVCILPQTINIKKQQVVELLSKCFNSHPRLTIIARDEVSKKNADILFMNCTRLLMPDVVTSLIGDKTFSYSSSKRSGVMFCIRNDGEKFYSDDQILSLRKKFIGIKTSVCDTTIFKSAWVWNKQRELLLREILENFSKQQLIITDRYHGTIFSQIVNTPVIVLSSTDHKLSSGVSWFPKMYFEKNVFFAVNLNEAFAIAKQILERKGVIENPSYFRDKYYAGALKV